MGALTGSAQTKGNGGVGIFGALSRVLEPILGSMYGNPTEEEAPPVEEPAAMPTTPIQAADETYLASAKRSNKAKTIIAGNLEPKSKKKTLLG